MGSFNNQNLPLVSICIPAYNAESTIAETLDTVLAQDYPFLDIVISDNQSTDNTKAIVQQYADHGVRYVYHSEGRPDWAAKMPKYIGGFANWNYVLSQGYGEYSCLFHSDDMYEKTIVRKQVLVMLENPQVGAVFTQARTIGEDSRPIRMGITKLPKELKGQSLFTFFDLINSILSPGDFLFTPSVMLRRSVIERVGGFDERSFLTAADLEMWLRIAQNGYKIAIIDEPLLNYRISQQQFSSQYNKLRTNLADFFLVMDHYLSNPDVKRQVTDDALFHYELQRTSDDITRAVNMVVLGNYTEALDLLNSVFGRKEYHAGLQKKKYMRHFFLALLLFGVLRCGLGRFAGNFYQQYYQPWIRQKQMKPL